MVQRDLDERTFRKSTAGARAKCRAADSSTQYERSEDGEGRRNVNSSLACSILYNIQYHTWCNDS
jgi:hypothetical protein